MKRFFPFLALLAGGILACVSCSSLNSGNQADRFQSEHEYHIGGLINDTVKDYPQFNMEGVNVSNTYFPEYKNLWMQAIVMNPETQQTDQKFTITLYKVDLDGITLPHTLNSEEGEEAVIGWFDQKVMESKGTLCSGVDNGCMYTGSLKRGDLKVTITSVKDQVAEGIFEGTLNLQGTGFCRFTKKEDFKKVSNGHFRIQFRRDAK